MTVAIAVRDLRKTYWVPGSTGTRGTAPAKQLAGARKRAVAKHALDGISFDIADGERLGIVGENGAGKSTLLQILAGLVSPTSGKIDIQGYVHAALTLGVGLREELTGRENLYLDAEIQGLSRDRIDDQVEAMVEFAELGNFIDEQVRTYSSGMKSRLTFTSLVFVEPEILLLDETLSAGDQFFQKKAARAVREVCDRGKIVIIVSHGLASIVEMCTRCIWLHEGKVEADGDPLDVTSVYREFQRHRIEERIFTDFRSRADAWSSPGRADISNLSLSRDAEQRGDLLFDPRAPFRVQAEVDLAEHYPNAELHLWIERMDGIRVTENKFALDGEGPAEPGRYRLDARLDRLLLGPAYYLLGLELRSAGGPLAGRSVIFRVDTGEPAIGGTPVLYAPIQVSAVRR